MKNKQQRPELPEQIRDAISLPGHIKYTKLSRREQKVYDILKQGKTTVVQITNELYFSDPRGYIRSLRDKGISVFDEWVDNKDTRYKLYWIEPEKTDML